MADDESYSDSRETNRVLLQIYHERSNQLANMLIALNGFVLAFIGGLLTFAGSNYFSPPQCFVSTNCLLKYGSCDQTQAPWVIIIAINIAIIVMIIWRYYAHYIDNDIASCYQKIFWFEHQVGVKPDLTLLCNFEVKTLKLKKCKPYTAYIPNGLCDDQKFEKRYEVFTKLNEKNLMGSRSQDHFDFLILFVVGSLLIIEIGLLPHNSILSYFTYWILFIIYIIFLSGLFIPNKYISIQRNPNEKQIEQIINEIRKIHK